MLSSSQLDPASRTTVGKVSAIEDIQHKGIKIEAQWNHLYKYLSILKNEPLPSSKLTYRPCQIGVGRLVSTKQNGDFQGPTDNLPEGNWGTQFDPYPYSPAKPPGRWPSMDVSLRKRMQTTSALVG